jgi:hypothetical protein
MGTGIGHGFLAAFDTAWMIRGLALSHDPIDLLSQREANYNLLSQTTPQNLSKSYSEYSIDPATRFVKYFFNIIFKINFVFKRYLNGNLKLIHKVQVRHLYDDSNKSIYSNEIPSKTVGVKPQTLLTWSQMVAQPYGIHIENLTSSWRSGLAFCAIIHRFRNDLM